ncbi:uncharacterized protein BDZ83DRAFT_288829 [Colletotrichum acutatum]|uniref:Uncharacterized protein n=1 Tax=Glomerella acutata TaxID=27357 RepID=A0AAD8XJ60_GLOAC|nr:uncharacterized protein BDZ83DRAFT_288829 [Colletotrichum acutatum]KAK1725715.1 hypothetical protein BDZ83DRAFT_288829 [Colletotrichum acutatum]
MEWTEIQALSTETFASTPPTQTVCSYGPSEARSSRDHGLGWRALRMALPDHGARPALRTIDLLLLIKVYPYGTASAPEDLRALLVSKLTFGPCRLHTILTTHEGSRNWTGLSGNSDAMTTAMSNHVGELGSEICSCGQCLSSISCSVTVYVAVSLESMR